MRPAAYRSLTRCAPRSRFSMQARSDHTPVVLGIETSCDDTAIAVVNGKRQILYEASASQWFVSSARRGLTCTLGPNTGASTREFILHLRCANTRMVLRKVILDLILLQRSPCSCQSGKRSILTSSLLETYLLWRLPQGQVRCSSVTVLHLPLTNTRPCPRSQRRSAHRTRVCKATQSPSSFNQPSRRAPSLTCIVLAHPVRRTIWSRV